MTDALARLASALSDRYRIERELGTGGMATVYLAEDLKHQRKVAIKVLRQELSATLGSERFAREIAVAARLQHPHILGLLDSGEADGFFYYVMPYVDGETLRDRLARGGELPVHEAVRLLGEITDALAAAHKGGVVHRDIKPENILLSGRHAMVMDFGVAKAVTESTGAHQLTSIGVALGTPAYMAPEQATADPQMDGRVDIYALGVLAYEMLTGQPPFHGLNPQQTLAAHVTQAPAPLGQRRPGLSPVLEGVVMRCLAKRPADRFQSADDLVTALEPLTTPSGGTTPHATVPYQAAVSAPRTRRTWLGAGAVVAVVAIAAVAWMGWRNQTPQPIDIRTANVRQITRDPLPEIHPAISPDGREVAYQAGWSSGESHIEVRDIQGGRPLILTEGKEGTQWLPSWMPDGRSIIFVQPRTTEYRATGAWKVPRLGGEPVLPDSLDMSALNRGHSFVERGDSVVVTTAAGLHASYPIAGVYSRAVRGTVRWRSDGSMAAFMVDNVDYVTGWTNIGPSSIWILVPGKPMVRATDEGSLNASPAWLPDGTLLYVSNRDGSRDIWAVRLGDDGAPIEATRTRLTTGLDVHGLSVSDDGHTLAYARAIVRQNVYAVAVPTGKTASVRDAEQVTTGNQMVERFNFSRDGRWLAFDSNREGNQDIFIMPAEGGEARRVTRDPGNAFSPSFSGDGSQIAFHSTRNATRDIYLINTDGSGETRLTSDAAQSYHPALSPDGNQIVYGNLSTRAFIGLLRRKSRSDAWADPVELPAEGGAFNAHWSPDGGELVYDGRSSPRTIAILRLDGTRRVIVEEGADLKEPGWPDYSPDGRTIYFFARDATGRAGVYQVSAAGGTPSLAVRFDDPRRQLLSVGSIGVGNGKVHFVVMEIESDIYVMDLVWQ